MNTMLIANNNTPCNVNPSFMQQQRQHDMYKMRQTRGTGIQRKESNKMEKDQQTTMPSTSIAEDIAMNDVEVAAAAACASITTTIPAELALNEVYASQEQIEAVFSNYLIADNIMSHLNFGDLQAAREVSKTFHGMVETCERFKDAEVLCITSAKPPISELNCLLESGRIWRRIRIGMSLWNESLRSQINRVLENVEFVQLINDSVAPDTEGIRSIIPFVQDVVSSTPNIRHVKIVHKLTSRRIKESEGNINGPDEVSSRSD